MKLIGTETTTLFHIELSEDEIQTLINELSSHTYSNHIQALYRALVQARDSVS